MYLHFGVHPNEFVRLFGLLGWLPIGFVVGAIASKAMRRSYGVANCVVLGLVGAVVGGFISDLFFQGDTGVIGDIGFAILGAMIVIWLAHRLLH